MSWSGLDRVLWFCGVAFPLVLLSVLMVRQRWRTFKIFTFLVAFQIVEGVLLNFVHGHAAAQYKKLYWTCDVLDTLTQLGVVYEIAVTVLRPEGEWLEGARKGFAVLSAGAIIVALILTRTVGTTLLTVDESVWQARVNIFTAFLVLGIYLAILAVAGGLLIRWQSHVMALAQGFTLWLVTAATTDVAYIRSWSQEDLIVGDHIRNVVCIMVFGYWIVSFWLPERVELDSTGRVQARLVVLGRILSYHRRA